MSYTRTPKSLWRVVATGGRREYWEPGSRTYASRGWADARATNYRERGATDVRIYRADLEWRDVTEETE